MRLSALRRRPLVALVAIVGLATAFAGGAYATHRFTDVPTSAFYHADAAWLADNGITTGCAAGKYCPNDPVTRGQMATFLHRLVNQTRTGYYTCAGDQFIPDSSDAEYHSVAGMRYRTSGTTVYRCNVVIPDGATITQLSFAVLDSSNDGEFAGGGLYRTALVGNVGSEIQIAGTPGTGSAATGGNQTVESAIVAATVDNERYAYFVLGLLDGYASDVGMYGARVAYTYRGVPAP